MEQWSLFGLSEYQELRADGLDGHGAIFGFGDLAAMARGFGLNGHLIDVLRDLDARVSGHIAGNQAEVWDFRIQIRLCHL
ncbi:hypothetical protein [Aliihoeflea sp. PC F10.4]